MAKQLGGSWTVRKLDVLENYLRAYLTALSKYRDKLKLGYIDAFAGDGTIQLATSEPEAGQSILIDEQETEQIRGLVRGSAQRALELDPGFDGYVFIERDKESAKRLHELKRAFPGKRIAIYPEDANACLTRLCNESEWKRRRAVVFLDPTGMQVDWATMEVLAATKALDVWIWFPLGVGSNRLLTRSGIIPETWQSRLDRIFGTSEWKTSFYAEDEKQTLFGVETVRSKIATPLSIASYYNDRLKSIFPAVAPNPRIMHNSTNNPIYLLCFASANPGRGGQIAVQIAKHLLNKA